MPFCCKQTAISSPMHASQSASTAQPVTLSKTLALLTSQGAVC
jgi:hypothetical protein